MLTLHFTTAMTPTISSKDIAAAFFTCVEDSVYQCRCNARVKQSKKAGYTNLVTHVKSKHSDYVEETRRTLRDRTLLFAKIPDERDVTVHKWLDWVVCEDLAFTLVERPSTRKYFSLSPIGSSTLKRYVVGVAEVLRNKIKSQLPDQFGLVIDGWTSSCRHFVALFAVFADAERLTSDDELVRKHVLLSFSPLDDEQDLSAQSYFDHVGASLECRSVPGW